MTVPFRRDLYRGTAEDYDRFRPPYPPALVASLVERVPLTTSVRVLDLACGTGQIAFALAPQVAEVRAVDQEPGAVALGSRTAAQRGVDTIRWQVGSAEDVPLEGVFALVAIGNAFHRLDRSAVATRLVPHIAPGGCVALLWGGSPWPGDAPWQRQLADAVEHWTAVVDAGDRVPARWQEAIERDPHAAVLQRAGLSYEGTSSFTVTHRWTVASLVGFVFSTSVLSRATLGPHAAAFEADLGHRLLPLSAEGSFLQDLTFALELARG